MSEIPVASPFIESLFRLPVAAAEQRGPGDPSRLFEEEREGQQRWAPKRIHEFAAGRQCGHLALTRLGRAPVPLKILPDRRPAWPAGIVGSITHCAGYAAAVVSDDARLRSLGIDAERAEAVGRHLWPRILTETEAAYVEAQPASLQLRLATLVFSAKEAFYKCQYAVRSRWLEFHDAEVRLESLIDGAHGFDFTVITGDLELTGRGAWRDAVVITAVAWPADAAAQ